MSHQPGLEHSDLLLPTALATVCESPTWFEHSDLLLPTALAPVVDNVNGEVVVTDDAERDIEGGDVSEHDDGWRVMDVAASSTQTPRQAEGGTATERTTHKYVMKHSFLTQ